MANNYESLRIVSLDSIDLLNKVSARETARICSTLDEGDAEAALKALLKKYPGLYLKVLSRSYIHNTATVESLHHFMVERCEEW